VLYFPSVVKSRFDFFFELVTHACCSLLSFCVCWFVCEVQVEAETEAKTEPARPRRGSLEPRSALALDALHALHAPPAESPKEDTVGFSCFLYSSLLFVDMNPLLTCIFCH
jgi:hypothetical protein